MLIYNIGGFSFWVLFGTQVCSLFQFFPLSRSLFQFFLYQFTPILDSNHFRNYTKCIFEFLEENRVEWSLPPTKNGLLKK